MRKLIAALMAIMLAISGLTVIAEGEFTTYNEIALGSKGNDVSLLQTRLKELGYYTKAIDGDYGNGTKTAVASFQARNGLTENGIASVETVTAIYSEDAIAAPPTPALSITSIAKGNTTRVTVRNNLDVTVDSVELKMLTFDAGGNVCVPSRDINSPGSNLTGFYGVSGKTISPGGTVTYDLDVAELIDYDTKFMGAYIWKYHTVDGKDYQYHPSQVYVYKSDNSIYYPTDESEPDCMSDDELTLVNTIKLGVNSGSITHWISSLYMYPEGEYVDSVADGGIFDLAGIKAGDVITGFDDIDALSGHSWERAKAKMLAGETVNVHYVRNTKEYTTQIALDMDKILQQSETETKAADESVSLADQLQSIGELYEKGLLTEEEYVAAKAKILG